MFQRFKAVEINERAAYVERLSDIIFPLQDGKEVVEPLAAAGVSPEVLFGTAHLPLL